MSREEIGTLIIVILKARNLNDKHKFRKQDVLAKVSLNGSEKQTKVDFKGGQHPIWDEEVRFPVMKADTGKFRNLEISCWSKEPRDEDLLGKATLDISKTIQTGEFDDWVPLAIDDNVRGDIYLEMTYYSNGPAPPEAIAPPQAAAPKPNAGPTNVAGLGVPQSGANLMRRPSKLSPSERLSRPAYYRQQSPPQSYQNGSHGGSPSPHPHSQSYQGNSPSPHPQSQSYQASSHPQQGYPAGAYSAQTPPYGGHDGRVPPQRNSSLPPLHESNPHPPPHRLSAAQPPPPNLLRPGAASGALAPRPYSDARPDQQNPYLAPSHHGRPSPSPTPAPAQSNPYLTSTTPTPAPAPNLYGQQGPPAIYQPAAPASYTPGPQQPPPASHPQPPPHSYTPAPTGPPALWSQGLPTEGGPGVGGFAFPIPSISTPSAAEGPEPGPYPPGAWPGTPPVRAASPYDTQYPGHRRVSDPRGDVGYNPRYQSPLPLPPGAKREPSREAPAPPPPPPKAHSPSPPPAPRPQRRQERGGSPPPPKAQAAPAGMTSDRLMALKYMEEEEARRLEQEKRDLELAMQLDRELNMG